MIKGACYHMNCVLQGNKNDEALKYSVTRKYHESFLVGVKGATSLLTFPSEDVANHGLLPVSVNTVLLEHSHAHSCLYPLRLLSYYNSRVEYLQQRPYVALKT